MNCPSVSKQQTMSTPMLLVFHCSIKILDVVMITLLNLRVTKHQCVPFREIMTVASSATAILTSNSSKRRGHASA